MLRFTSHAQISSKHVNLSLRLAKRDAKWPPGKDRHVLPVLYQRSVTTKIPRGENKARLRTIDCRDVAVKPEPVKKTETHRR